MLAESMNPQTVLDNRRELIKKFSYDTNRHDYEYKQYVKTKNKVLSILEDAGFNKFHLLIKLAKYGYSKESFLDSKLGIGSIRDYLNDNLPLIASLGLWVHYNTKSKKLALFVDYIDLKGCINKGVREIKRAKYDSVLAALESKQAHLIFTPLELSRLTTLANNSNLFPVQYQEMMKITSFASMVKQKCKDRLKRLGLEIKSKRDGTAYRNYLDFI